MTEENKNMAAEAVKKEQSAPAKKTENAGVYQEINEYFSEALLSEKNGLLHDYIRRYISKFDKALEGRRESGKKHSDEEEIEKLRNEMIKLEESI